MPSITPEYIGERSKPLTNDVYGCYVGMGNLATDLLWMIVGTDPCKKILAVGVSPGCSCHDRKSTDFASMRGGVPVFNTINP